MDLPEGGLDRFQATLWLIHIPLFCQVFLVRFSFLSKILLKGTMDKSPAPGKTYGKAYGKTDT